MSTESARFYGKYRGTVTDNRDPIMKGRIKAQVPTVLGEEESGWALPCVPYAGSGIGFFFVPPVGANVWIEFEGGNPDYPIWTGCYWGTTEVPPATPGIPEIKMIKTDTATLKLDDTPGAGGITIETSTGLKITMNVTGIEITNGVAIIKLAQASVSINNGALEVT